MDALPPSPAAPVPPAMPTGLALTPQDVDYLRLLSIFHYVVAGLAVVFGLIFVIHIVMGIAVLNGSMPMSANGQPSTPEQDRFMGWMFVGMGGFAVSMGLALGALLAYAGRCLRNRRRYLLCMVVAGLSCLFTPFGTVLGVFTLIVLLRPQVKAAFEANTPARP